MEDEIVKIGELSMEHYYNETMMVDFSTIYAVPKLLIKQEEKEYELLDFYCKNMDCDCTQSRMVVLLNGNEVGEIWYDYKERIPVEPSNYIFLLSEILKMEGFDKILEQRHTIVKLEFELFKNNIGYKELKAREAELKAQEAELKKLPIISPVKIGRNDLCLCGSGKKYKKCCLNIVE